MLGAPQAFMLFEEAIPDSAGERVALASIVGALHRCRIFPAEPRATLVHKATGYSAKLLRKADQCRAVLACSHLFWQVRRRAYQRMPLHACQQLKYSALMLSENAV